MEKINTQTEQKLHLHAIYVYIYIGYRFVVYKRINIFKNLTIYTLCKRDRDFVKYHGLSRMTMAL